MNARRSFPALDSWILPIAASDLTVLITGDEDLARSCAQSIHRLSGRRHCPILEVGPPFSELDQLEEFLGRESRARVLEALASLGLAANNFPLGEPPSVRGTLYLQRVGELTPANQKQVLRILESRETPQSGDGLDFRIIAACARPLTDSIYSGAFRAELYFRLAEVEIRVPWALAQASVLARRRAEKRAIEQVLAKTGGSQSQTASLLRLSRQSLADKMRGLDIDLG